MFWKGIEGEGHKIQSEEFHLCPSFLSTVSSSSAQEDILESRTF